MNTGAWRRPVEILLVEDDTGEVRLLQEALKGDPVPTRLSVVGDGAAALAFLQRQGASTQAIRPDLILLTIQLPVKDGLEVLREIKSDPALCSIPAIVLTSSQSHRHILRSYELQANGYIVKPVDLEEFFTVVKAIVKFWGTVVTLPSDLLRVRYSGS
jgi:chemotaxis family two-component system response regulator Rcp1